MDEKTLPLIRSLGGACVLVATTSLEDFKKEKPIQRERPSVRSQLHRTGPVTSSKLGGQLLTEAVLSAA